MKSIISRTLILITCFGLFVLSSCDTEQKLPYFGKYPVKTSSGYDTIIKTIPDFEFTNQDSLTIDNESFDNSIYITDFFFTSCPSICPIMKRQMLRVYEVYEENEDVKFLSHTIDPKRDSVATLKAYANKLELGSTEKWHFVTGYKDELYMMAEQYMIMAYEDEDVPGGFEHSGQFILVDKNRMVRGYYDGTNEEAVDVLIEDIKVLLNEK